MGSSVLSREDLSKVANEFAAALSDQGFEVTATDFAGSVRVAARRDPGVALFASVDFELKVDPFGVGEETGRIKIGLRGDTYHGYKGKTWARKVWNNFEAPVDYMAEIGDRLSEELSKRNEMERVKHQTQDLAEDLIEQLAGTKAWDTSLGSSVATVKNRNGNVGLMLRAGQPELVNGEFESPLFLTVHVGDASADQVIQIAGFLAEHFS